MVKSLFDLSLAVACSYTLNDSLALLPCDSKQRILEFMTAHDKIAEESCIALFSNPFFGCNLTQIHFYLSSQLTDEILEALTTYSPRLEQVTIIECKLITDRGIISTTVNQRQLVKLELRNLHQLTSRALKVVRSPHLRTVDLSGCHHLTSEGIFYLVFNNPSIKNLCLNNCIGLDDQALYDIGHFLQDNLRSLELDFLHTSKIIQRAEAIYSLSQRCPNIAQLSLCRFFNRDHTDLEDAIDADERVEEAYNIEGAGLRYVDLYGNYFSSLPNLPPTIHSIRLSVTGQEDVSQLAEKLLNLKHLLNIHLQLLCTEEDARSIENANRFLSSFIPLFGYKITRLSITVERLVDSALILITQLPNLSQLALDVLYINPFHLWKLFSGGLRCRGAALRSLRMCRLRITYRALFAIGRCAKSLTELECSHMPCVDDRFLTLLGENCKWLTSVNFNGCKFVTDKGLAKLARNCRLKEVRIRGTACTDLSLRVLAQHCPDIEWVSYADYSGKPKFTEGALQSLKDSCMQRVIC